MDIVGPFTATTRGNKYYLLAIDLFTHNIEVKAIADVTSVTIKNFVLAHIIQNHGTPKTILTDNAKYFTSELIQTLYNEFGIRAICSSPYNPQGNGTCERANGTFNMLLRAAAGGDIETTEWDLLIPAAVFAYRRTPHASTGESPFYLEHLRDPRMPSEASLPGSADKNLDVWKHLMKVDLVHVHEQAKMNIIEAQAQRNERLSASQPPMVLEEGELVWLHQDQVKGSTKFYWPWKGPYRVTRKQDDNVYELSDLGGTHTVPKVNIRRLREYKQALPTDHTISPIKYGLLNPTPNIDQGTHDLTPTALPPALEAAILPRNVTVPSSAPVELFPNNSVPKTPVKLRPVSNASTPAKGLYTPETVNIDTHDTTSVKSTLIPASPSFQASSPNERGSAKTEGLSRTLSWLDAHNLSKKGAAGAFRDFASSYIKSVELATEVEKVLRKQGLSEEDKKEQAKDMLESTTTEQWYESK